jgi:hypothetical protein
MKYVEKEFVLIGQKNMSVERTDQRMSICVSLYLHKMMAREGERERERELASIQQTLCARSTLYFST